MKKGNNRGKGHKPKGKAIPKWKTRYIKATSHSGYDKEHYLSSEPPSKKKESVSNWDSAFNNPEAIIDSRPKADVHCINEARKARGQPEITTPHMIAERRKIEYIINSEAKVYSRWADRAEESKELCELKYYFKLDHRKAKALEYKGRVFPKKNEVVGPPKPTAIDETNVHQHIGSLPKGNAYGFAYKKPVIATGLAPSGEPIATFLEGGKYPPKVAEVTQCNQHWPKSVMTKEELEREARNNPSFTPNKADVKWHINNVPPEDWPDIIKEHAYYASGGWKPDNQKLSGGKANVLNGDYEALERDYQELQLEHYRQKDEWISKHEEQQNTIGILYQELHETQMQLKLAELHGVTSGQYASQVESPLSISELATQFNIFKSRWTDNPLNAFFRERRVSGKQRKELRQFFDKQCEVRILLSEERKYYRRLSERSKLYSKPRKAVRVREEVQSLRELGNHAGYAAWLQYNAPSPEYVTLCNKRKAIQAVRHDRTAYANWSANNSSLNCNKAINNRVQLAIMQEEQRVRDIMSTTTYKVLKKVKDVALMEVNPWERKRQADKAKHSHAMRMKSLKDKRIQASRIKRELEDKLERDLQRERIREAQRLAH